ncbi:MAG: hypothetical protein QM650_15760 [Microlunatus sp.]
MSEPPYAPYPPPQQRRQAPPGYGQQRPAAPYPQQPQPQRSPLPHRHPDAETTNQVRAAYAARNELGPEYEDAIAAGLADRVEELVAYRTAELRHADARSREDGAERRRNNTQRFTLGIVSLGTGIPITAIAATGVDPGLLGVIAAWGGIVGVNAMFALGSRRKSRE